MTTYVVGVVVRLISNFEVVTVVQVNNATDAEDAIAQAKVGALIDVEETGYQEVLRIDFAEKMVVDYKV